MSIIIPIQGLNAVAWTLCSAAIVLTGGRFFIRLRRLGKLQPDNYLNGLALVALIAFVATYQVYLPIQYELELHGLGLSTALPSPDQQVFLLRVQLANELFFWFTIFFVKFSFLTTYWFIFNVSARFRYAWYALTAYTVITFLAIVPSPAWQCGDPAKYDDLVQCNQSLSELTLTLITYWCVLNVLGDLFIFTLPVIMLRQLHMSRADKLGLALVFGLVLLIILFDILRSVFTVDAYATSFPDSNAVWALCEPTIAVMVCALPAYRSVLPSKSRRSQKSYRELLMESELANSERRKKSKTSNNQSSRWRNTTAQRSQDMDNWEMDSISGRLNPPNLGEH